MIIRFAYLAKICSRENYFFYFKKYLANSLEVGFLSTVFSVIRRIYAVVFEKTME